MYTAPKVRNMPRALLTDRERDVVEEKDDVNRTTRSTLMSRIEQKIQIMREDARLLRKHQPELAGELQRAVCEEPLEERLDHVEDEIEEIKRRLAAVEQREGEDEGEEPDVEPEEIAEPDPAADSEADRGSGDIGEEDG